MAQKISELGLVDPADADLLEISQASAGTPVTYASKRTTFAKIKGLLGTASPANANGIFPLNAGAVGVASSGSVAGYPASALNSPGFNILSGATPGGGWLQTLGATAQWIDIAMPFAVVIGDSIAEGHPALHGRLHPNGTASFDANYPSAAGQLNYELSRLTCSHWYNHGIGGQTTAQILARFNRDALGQTFDPGDGRGSKTLPGKPYAVLVNAGGNDLATVAEADIKANLVSMLSALKQNNIVPIFMSIAPSSANDAAANTKSASINAWMLSTFKDMGAYVFDLWTWGSNGSGGVKADRYADAVHPSKAGYALLAQDVIETVTAHLVLDSVRVEFKADPTTPPASFVIPRLVDISSEGVSRRIFVAADSLVINKAQWPSLQSPIVRLSIAAPAAGTSGVNKVEGSFARLPQPPQPKGRQLSVNAVVMKSAGVWSTPDFRSQGVYGISAGPSGVTLTVDDAASFLTGWIGSSAVRTNVRISASWGAVPVSEVTLNFGDGVNVLDPTTSAVPDGLYIAVLGVAP